MRRGSVTYHVEVPEAPRPGVLDASPAPEWPRVLAGHPLRAVWATPAGPRELVGWRRGRSPEDLLWEGRHMRVPAVDYLASVGDLGG